MVKMLIICVYIFGLPEQKINDAKVNDRLFDTEMIMVLIWFTSGQIWIDNINRAVSVNLKRVVSLEYHHEFRM